MRLGSIGYRLPGVETISYRSASTLLEYDVVLLELDGIPPLYYSNDAFEGERLISDSASPTMLADMDRGREELSALLDLGRTLVVFVPGDLKWYVATGRTRNDGTPGRPRIVKIVDGRSASDLLPFVLRTVKAAGTQLDLRAGEPFATFWRRTSSFFAYSGYIVEPKLNAVVIRGTNFPVAGIVTSGTGRVILLPDLGEAFWGLLDHEEEEDEEDPGAKEQDGTDQSEPLGQNSQVFVDALVELVRSLAGGETVLPQWTERFRVEGEAKLLGSLIDRQAAVAEAQKDLDRATKELALLQQDKLLFAGTGEPLRRRVARVFEALGADVDDADEGRADLKIRWRDQVAFVKVKGVSGSAGERDAAQLEKWAAEELEESGQVPKPILVINAFRDREDLNDRIKEAFPKQMRPYAEARGQCLVTSLQLLLMESEARDDASRREGALDALFSNVGVFADFSDPQAHIQEVTSKEEGG